MTKKDSRSVEHDKWKQEKLIEFCKNNDIPYHVDDKVWILCANGNSFDGIEIINLAEEHFKKKLLEKGVNSFIEGKDSCDKEISRLKEHILFLERTYGTAEEWLNKTDKIKKEARKE